MKKCQSLTVEGTRGRGRPGKTYKLLFYRLSLTGLEPKELKEAASSRWDGKWNPFAGEN